MMFADDSPAASKALQRVFGLDAAAAERLLREVPVVVKRAATPEVAAELIDELQKIGAQVVLLPSARTASTHAEPARATDAPRKSLWGGLDLESAERREHGFELGLAPALDMSPRARDTATQTPAAPLPAPRASLISASSPPDLRPSFGPSAEVDFDPGERAPSGAASLAPASAPTIRGNGSSLPPALAGDELGLGTVPPLPSLELAAPMPKPKAPPPPPPITVARGMRKPPRVPGPPPPPVALPAVPSSLPAPLPAVPSVPAPSLRERRIPAAALAGPTPPSSRSLELAEVERTPPRVPGLAAPKTGSDNYWSARRTGETANEAPPRAQAEQEPAIQTPAPPPVAEARKAPQASAPVVVPKQRGLALLEMLAGALVLYAAMRFDNSVFYGNATPVSLVLHGFAFYGIGIGLVGLWP